MGHEDHECEYCGTELSKTGACPMCHEEEFSSGECELCSPFGTRCKCDDGDDV